MPRKFIHSFTVFEGSEWIPAIGKMQIPNAKELRRLRREALAKDATQVYIEGRYMHCFRAPSWVPDTGPFVTWDVKNGWRHRIRVRKVGEVGRIAQLHNWDIRRVKGIQTTFTHLLCQYDQPGHAQEIKNICDSLLTAIADRRKEAIEQERRRNSKAAERLADFGRSTG